MADLGTNFDPASAPPSDRDFDLIPNGWQPAQAIESDVSATKDGTGTIVSFTFEILSGQYERRRIWKRMNVQNKSAESQAIGQRELADLCRALSLPSMTNTEQAHGKPLMIRVGVEKGKDGYEDKNTVKAFKPFEQTAPGGTPAAHVVASAGGSGAGAAARPWGNR